MGNELAIASIRLRGAAEAGVLAHGPRPGRIHRWIDASRVRILTWLTERVIRIEPSKVSRSIHRLERRTRLRLSTHPGNGGTGWMVAGAGAFHRLRCETT